MSRWQRPGLTLCWFLPPIRQWNLILGADLQKQKVRRALKSFCEAQDQGRLRDRERKKRSQESWKHSKSWLPGLSVSAQTVPLG